jgi:hypothetical protein
MSLFKNYPTYPPILHANHWEQHKGIVVKLFKKNVAADLAAKMKDAESAFGRIPAAAFSDITVDTSTRAACDRALTNATTLYCGPIKTLTDNLFTVRRIAEKRGGEFRSNRFIPGSTRKLVDDIARTAQRFTDDFRQFVNEAIKDIKMEKAMCNS